VIICTHCYAPIKITDGYLTSRINLLVTRDDSSPIQIGTTGEWKGRKFEITGRVRCVFDEGYTNNWTMVFDGGDMLMLVESYGLFAVYEKTVLEKDVSFSVIARMQYEIETEELNVNKHYTLERRTVCQNIEIEGEAWLFDEEGQFTCLELAAQGGGRRALICGKGRVDYKSFVIHYHSFADFKFEQLRAQQLGAVTKEISCKNCNRTIPLYAWPLSQSASCSTCSASYFFEKGEWKYRARMKLHKEPAIPLQARGTIRGTEYQVLGYMEKEDEDSYKWREYTLYNPAQGLAFLSEYNGHWIFLKEMGEAPVLVMNNVMAFNFDGKTFRKYNQYRFSLIDCRGEFPGNAFDNNKPKCKEFIAPPDIWVREIHEERGLSSFHGTHISAKELHAAFGNISLPYAIGVGAVQPVPGQVDAGVLRNSILGIIGAFLLLFLLSIVFNQEKVVYENAITLPDSTTLSPIVTPKFRLDKWRSNLQFYITAPVNNNWFEAGITLINADNGNEYSIEQGVEKYSGYEGGESWSEGNDRADAILHKIPAGNYFLQITPARADYTIGSFLLRVTYDVPMWRNFFIFAIFAIIPLFVLMISIYRKEGARWENSSFYHNK
jgi:uncharacterized membrane protein YeaQ/YmgE (transglycosylase-associated protein family)